MNANNAAAGEGPSTQPDLVADQPPVVGHHEHPIAIDEAALAPNEADAQQPQQHEPQPPSFRDAVKKIRFLTLTPKQFAENVARSNILSQTEAFAILMNISSPTHDIYPMPAGFSTSTKSRAYIETTMASVQPPPPPAQRVQPFLGFREEDCVNVEREQMLGILIREPTPRNLMETRKFFCLRTIRQQIDYFNTSVSDCSLMFSVDRSICITGIQVPTQVLGEQTMHSPMLPERYSELLYAHLLDSQGSRLTYTHCTSRVRYDSLLEISFDRPVFIQRNKQYKIGVAFNKLGWYPMCTCVPSMTCEGVYFNFNGNESVRDGLIRSIVFTASLNN